MVCIIYCSTYFLGWIFIAQILHNISYPQIYDVYDVYDVYDLCDLHDLDRDVSDETHAIAWRCAIYFWSSSLEELYIPHPRSQSFWPK